jgi:hypothetical protein
MKPEFMSLHMDEFTDSLRGFGKGSRYPLGSLAPSGSRDCDLSIAKTQQLTRRLRGRSRALVSAAH